MAAERLRRAWQRGMAAWLRMLRQRYRALRPPGRRGLHALALRRTRSLVVAEALAALVLGFSLDDLHVLRAPGFLVGAAAAVALLAFGGLLHARRLARALEDLPAADAHARLLRFRGLGRVTLFLAAAATVVWFVVFSAGVPPWAA